MWTKKDVNRYWNDRSVMYFEHAKKPYQLSEDYGLKKEWIFYIMCKEMHNFYDDVDSAMHYLNLRHPSLDVSHKGQMKSKDD